MALFEPIFYVLGIIIDLYFKIIVLQVVLSWLIHFKILQPSNSYTQKAVEIIDSLTAPAYRKIARFVPRVSGIDLSPMVLMLILIFLSRLVFRISLFLV